MNELQLRKAGAEKVAAARAIQDLAAKESRSTTVEETSQIKALIQESQALIESANAAHQLEEAEAGLKTLAPRKAQAASGDAIPAEPKTPDPKCGFTSFGHFAEAVFKAGTPGARLSEREFNMLAAASGLNQGIGSEGGFTVPPEFNSKIWDGLSKEVDALLPLTDNYTVTGESLTFNANAETSRATGSRYGGVRSYWVKEADDMTASKPKMRDLTLTPHELNALCYVTDKLLRNSTAALEQWLTRALTDEILWETNNAIVNGTGVGKPLGIMASAATISVAKESSQANDTILEPNISKMWSQLHPRCRSNAIWLISPDIEPQLDAMFQPVKNVAGTENVGGYKSMVWDPSARTLKGRPVMPVEYCAKLGDLGDIILVDLKSYATGTRGGITSASSIHVQFLTNQTAFRFTYEVDGQPWLQSKITPANGGSDLSSFVTLAAR